MTKTSSAIFQDMLLTRGKYCVEMDCGSDISGSDFLLYADAASLDFECNVSGGSECNTITLVLEVKSEFARVSLQCESPLGPLFLYKGIKRLEAPSPFRADFYDYHYSLKDHVSQIDRILRLTEGNDELSLLFKSLRYEMSANIATLSARMDRLEQKFQQQDSLS